METRVALLFVVATTIFTDVSARAVNISNTWVLPEEGFPVFYRYFRDRISWYEADAVCQFHHANLVTGPSKAKVVKRRERKEEASPQMDLRKVDEFKNET
ncbi:hypothetical protein Trydic_g8166 [Trypoxylus dichotomus]